MDIRVIFGENVRKYRTALKLSQEAFAEECGLHRTYIKRFQRNVSLDNIQRIANALNLPPYKLLIEEDRNEPTLS